jgi:hypothetical protein
MPVGGRQRGGKIAFGLGADIASNHANPIPATPRRNNGYKSNWNRCSVQPQTVPIRCSGTKIKGTFPRPFN